MAQKRGGFISYKMTEDGIVEPYEINTTWWSTLNPESDHESLELQVARYLASRSIALVLQGVPGIYIHGALGTANDYAAAEASGINRDVNRGTIDAREVKKVLTEDRFPLRSRSSGKEEGGKGRGADGKPYRS